MDAGAPSHRKPLPHSRAAWREFAASTVGAMLFEDTHATPNDRTALLFVDPLGTIRADEAGELPAVFCSIEKALSEGFYVAGYLAYEAGQHLLQLDLKEHSHDGPLAFFGVYHSPENLAAAQPQEESALRLTRRQALCPEMSDSPETYRTKIDSVLRWIEAGDTYQVNLTTSLSSSFTGDVAELFGELAKQQPASYISLLHPALGEHVLSLSPELFFRLESDRRIVMRPMKGTAPLSTPADPGDPEQWLRTDAKNAAEHVMIVDLLRNDLGRICEAGTVAVEDLFTIERYRSLLQMTSTVVGRLRRDTSLQQLFTALFPSGSMTGAPKLRTMQVIADLEQRARGIYSGAIGYFNPDGTGTFSVAIRTAVLKDRVLTMGVGSGIVADSNASSELDECWLKCQFLMRATLPFELFETLRWNPGFVFLEEHLDRLENSAGHLGFQFDRAQTRSALEQFTANIPGKRRIRLSLARDGSLFFKQNELTEWPKLLSISLSNEKFERDDSFLRHKTTARDSYDRELARALQTGFDEVLFTNERDQLTEGAISTLLIWNGGWKTPPLAAGLLPGVARQHLIATAQVYEDSLEGADLIQADRIMLCNSVRGLGCVARIQLPSGAQISPPNRVEAPRLNLGASLPGM